MARLTDDAVCARRVGAAKNRAEVVRILDTVEHDDEGGRRRLRIGNQFIKFERAPLANVGNHTLMRRSARLAIEILVRNTTDGHAGFFGERQQLLQTMIARRPARIDTTRPLSALGNRVNAVMSMMQLLI